MNKHFASVHLHWIVVALLAVTLATAFSGTTLFAQDQQSDQQTEVTAPHPHDAAADSTGESAADSVAATHERESAATSDPSEQPAPPTVADIILQGKYLTILAIMLLAVILLFIRKINLWVRIGAMLLVFILFGLDLVYPLHPSPMCATTKLFMFKFTQGQFFVSFFAFFLVIFVPMLFGRKLFCGWVCPLGALQELINKIPLKYRLKSFNFGAFNAVRFTLLAMFFLTFFMVLAQLDSLGEETGAGGTAIWRAYSSYNIYDPVNMFELLHWQVDTIFLIMIVVLLGASLILYRPFCYAVCPVGALSWILEKLSPGKIRIDRNTCNDCGVCVIKSPCPTMAPLLKGDRFWNPDCTSCGECINTCPQDSIKFSFRK